MSCDCNTGIRSFEVVVVIGDSNQSQRNTSAWIQIQYSFSLKLRPFQTPFAVKKKLRAGLGSMIFREFNRVTPLFRDFMKNMENEQQLPRGAARRKKLDLNFMLKVQRLRRLQRTADSKGKVPVHLRE